MGFLSFAMDQESLEDTVIADDSPSLCEWSSAQNVVTPPLSTMCSEDNAHINTQAVTDYNMDSQQSQMTQAMPPLSLNLLSTQEFQEQVEIACRSEELPSQLTFDQATQLTQGVEPLSLEFISTLQFGSSNSQGGEVGHVLPSCLRDSVFSRTPQKQSQEINGDIVRPVQRRENVFDENVFLNYVQYPALAAQEAKECSSVFMMETQCPSTVNHQESPNQNDDIFMNETQLPSAAMNKENDSIFMNETECPLVESRSGCKEVQDDRTKTPIFLLPRLPTKKSRVDKCLTKNNSIFLETTQVPDLLNAEKLSFETRDDVVDTSIFLQETVLPRNSVHDRLSSPKKDKARDSVFFAATQVPIGLERRKSPVENADNSIFFEETQIPDFFNERRPPSWSVPKVPSVRRGSKEGKPKIPERNRVSLPKEGEACDSVFFAATQIPVGLENNRLRSQTENSPDSSVFFQETQIPDVFDGDRLATPNQAPIDSVFFDETQVPVRLDCEQDSQSNSISCFIRPTQVPNLVSGSSHSVFSQSTQLPTSVQCTPLLCLDTRASLVDRTIFLEETQVPELLEHKRSSDAVDESDVFLDNTENVAHPEARGKGSVSSVIEEDLFLEATQIPRSSFNEDRSSRAGPSMTLHNGCFGASDNMPKVPSSTKKKDCDKKDDLAALFEEPFDYYDTLIQLPCPGGAADTNSRSPNCPPPNLIESDSEVDDFILSSDVVDDSDETVIYDCDGEVFESQSKRSMGLQPAAPEEPEGEDCEITLAPSPDLLHSQADQPSVIYESFVNETLNQTVLVDTSGDAKNPTVLVDSDSTDSDVEAVDFSLPAMTHLPDLPNVSSNDDIRRQEPSAVTGNCSSPPIPIGNDCPEYHALTQCDSPDPVTSAPCNDGVMQQGHSLVTENSSSTSNDDDCPDYHALNDQHVRRSPRLILPRLLSLPGPSRQISPTPTVSSSRPKRNRKPTLKAIEGDEQRRRSKRLSKNSPPNHLSAAASSSSSSRERRTRVLPVENNDVRPLRLCRSSRMKKTEVAELSDSQGSNISSWSIADTTPAQSSSSEEVVRVRTRSRGTRRIASDLMDSEPVAPPARANGRITRQARKRRRKRVNVIWSDDDDTL